MSAPYPTDQRQYPGGMPPYPPTTGYPPNASPYPPMPTGYPAPAYPPPGNYGAGGYQAGYDPNVGFHQPGFSQPGYPQQQPLHQPGYGDHDPNKPQNPPYMDDSDPNYAKGFGFDDKSIRAGFIRRVYSILSVQLLVTLAFVILFCYHQGVKEYSHRNPQLIFIPMVGTIVFVCMIACCESVRRNSPMNVIVLGCFTLCESIVVGFISSTYAPEIVLMAVAITAAIVIGLTLFAFQTKYDVTSWGGGLCVVLLIFVIGSFIVGIFFRSEFAHFLVACAGAAVFCLFIVYDTQSMMGGNHKFAISPEEYVFAALNLYMDIIQLFIYMLRILQYLNKD